MLSWLNIRTFLFSNKNFCLLQFILELLLISQIPFFFLEQIDKKSTSQILNVKSMFRGDLSIQIRIERSRFARQISNIFVL